MFISTIFGDLGDLPVMVRRPKGALKILLEHSLDVGDDINDNVVENRDVE